MSRAAVPGGECRPGDGPLETTERAPLEGRPTLDDIGEFSFPASDPPASWTWETDGAAAARG